MMNGLAAANNASDVTQNHIVAISKKSTMDFSPAASRPESWNPDRLGAP
jgi:hypothetical protein